MKNKEIRTYAKEKGVRLWQIAAELGINDGNFSRRLRKELPEDQKQEILRIIDDLSSFVDTDFLVTESISVLRHELLKHGEIYNGFKASLAVAIEKYCICGLPFEPEEVTARRILDFLIGEEK